MEKCFGHHVLGTAIPYSLTLHISRITMIIDTRNQRKAYDIKMLFAIWACTKIHDFKI